MNIFAKILAASALFALSVPAVAADQAIIVLDGSGSMWGQIDGVPKLEIARSALRDVLTNAPAGLELGLMAYGHREKGNCSDIQLLVPPHANAGGDIIAAADNMKFLGKTPISAAVRQAAEALRFTEDKATVILITDGIETCEANPCAVAAELEERGLDFTAHVVGFGLSSDEGKQVSCLAEETGGRYFPAGDAAELTRVIGETVAVAQAQPEPEPEPVKEVLPEAAVKAPAEIPAGATIEVTWIGPNADRDYITVVEKGAPEDAYGDYARTDSGSPAKITMPDGLGAYEIRYVLAQSKRVLASQPVTLTAVSATVEALDTPVPGGTVEVEWTGPNADRDYITVVEKGAPEDAYGDYARTNSGSPAKITMPDALGAYEIRYVLAQSKRVLASVPVTLAEVRGNLSAPASAAVGAAIEVKWTGPGNWEDFIEIVPEGAAADAKPLRETRTSQGSPLSIFAPSSPGKYLIRYKMRDTGDVTATIPLIVE